MKTKDKRHDIGRFRVSQCQCNYAKCKDWHIAPVADVQGVRFTEEQAIAVATLLDGMDRAAEVEAADRLA